jgi:hypothetical protein
MAARFGFDVLAPLVGFSVVLGCIRTVETWLVDLARGIG